MTREENEKAVKRVLLEIKIKKLLMVALPVVFLSLLIYFLQHPFVGDMVVFVYYFILIIVVAVLILSRKIR